MVVIVVGGLDGVDGLGYGLEHIGGFGINSDLTWQAQGMLGYEFNELFSMGLGYRALGTDYSKDGFLYDIVSHGPVLGFEVKF